LIEYLNGGEKPEKDLLPGETTARFAFLKTLASQIDSKGRIVGTADDGMYYAKWYQENKDGTTGDWGKDTAWCACYLSWAMANTAEINNPPMEANVENLKSKFLGVQWRNPTEHFSSGDLIFFNFDEDVESDHVGVVLAIDGNYIYTIEGNTAGKVAVRKYDKSDKRILGYGVLS